jgi:hypothetical protein
MRYCFHRIKKNRGDELNCLTNVNRFYSIKTEPEEVGFMNSGSPSIPGYIDYQRREFCKDVKCEIQLELDKKDPGTEEYEKVRNICKTDCRYTTYQFHHWLMEKGYLIVRKEK